MEALVTHGKTCDLQFSTIRTPIPGANEVRVKVKAAAICGSDLGTYKRGPRVPYSHPHVMGHEFTGMVDAVGTDVDVRWMGKRVVVFPTVYCNECQACKSGHMNVCETRATIGAVKQYGDYNGAMAQYVCVPAQLLMELPDNVGYIQGAVIEPFSVALHAIHRAGTIDDKNIVIYGAGAIGLMVLELLKLYHPRTIAVIDVKESHLKVALEHGATSVFQADEKSACRYGAANEKADIVFDAVGLEATIDSSLHLLNSGGVVVMVGLASPQMSLDYRYVMDHEVIMVGCINYTMEEMDEIATLMENNKISTEGIITDIIGLEKGPEIFRKMAQGSGDFIKVVFSIND